MDIRIYGKEDKTLILANTVAFNYELTKEINKLPSINFALTKYDANWKLIEAEGYIYSADGLFVVKDISITDDEVEVYAVYDAEVFQYNHFPTVGEATGGLGSYAADIVRLRAMSGWTYEYNIASGVQPATVTINWDEYDEEGLSIYDALQVIIGRFNAEFTIDNVSKTLYVYEAMHCGEYRGAYIVEGFNLTDSTISISTDDIVTRLYPYGKDDLDITSVNPTGREWIDNFTYTDKVIEGVWKDERYEIAQNLYDDAVKLLEERCQPIVNFSLSMADMYAITGNTNFLIEVGDTVRLSIDGNESLQVVVKMITSEDDLENTQIELASKAGSLLDTIANLEDRSVSSSGGGGGGSTSWDAITGKPTTFPPSAHNHDERYYTETEIDSMLGGKQDKITSSNKLAYSLISGTPTIPTTTSELTNNSGFINQRELDIALDSKQDTLVSGVDIKTINGESVLGSGDIEIQGGGGSGGSLPAVSLGKKNNDTGTQSIGTTITKLNIGTTTTVNSDTKGDYFEVTAGQIKCLKAGVVLINASVYLTRPNSAGYMGLYLYKNGAESMSATQYGGASASFTVNLSTMIQVSAGDYFDIRGRASASSTFYTNNRATTLDIMYLNIVPEEEVTGYRITFGMNSFSDWTFEFADGQTETHNGSQINGSYNHVVSMSCGYSFMGVNFDQEYTFKTWHPYWGEQIQTTNSIVLTGHIIYPMSDMVITSTWDAD